MKNRFNHLLRRYEDTSENLLRLPLMAFSKTGEEILKAVNVRAEVLEKKLNETKKNIEGKLGNFTLEQAAQMILESPLGGSGLVCPQEVEQKIAIYILDKDTLDNLKILTRNLKAEDVYQLVFEDLQVLGF